MKRPETVAQRPSFARVIGAMIGVAYHTHPWMTLVYILTSLGFTALLIADLHLIRVLLDRLPLFTEGRISYQAVLLTILLLGGVNIICTLMNAGMNISFEYLSSLANARMTEAMGDKASRLELIRFESAELYDGIEKAHAGRGRGFDAMETVIASVVFHGGYFVFLGIYLVQLEPVLVLGVFVAFLPVALSRAIRASAFYRTEGKVAPLRREFNHYEACLTDRTYFKETRTTGAVPFFRRRYDQTLEAYNREMWRTELRTGVIDLTLKVLTLGGYVGLLLLLVRFVIAGRISPGLFGAVYFTMDSIFKWFDELFDRLGFAYENAAFGANYLAFLESPERAGGHAPLPRDRGVELRQVSFRYPGATENAIESVTLSIRPGEAVAIVGENGAGKSSLVRLIAGLYQPDCGSVHLGEVDLRDAADETRFHRLSAVFQQYQRYRMTLLDNVRLADPHEYGGTGRDRGELARSGGSDVPPTRTPTPDDVDERARAAAALNLAGFYERRGKVTGADLDCMLSREFGGIDLSGGEWQRVAIARGLYRQYDTIILDEPTAAIDPIEEDRVYRMFLDAARGKTAIIVTHRLGLARIADRILVMERGRIVQDGSHAELIAAAGLYARMFRSQAAWYEREAEER
jgi:ATP-binding cassette, subfamily B, bacterial